MLALAGDRVNVDTDDFASSPYCKNHLKPFLRWLLRRHRDCGGVTEIRVIADRPTKGIWSAWFDPQHRNQLVEQLLPDSDGPREKIPYGESPRIGEAHFYFTMQPVKPALLARSAYEFARCNATSDADIVCYSLFAVDVDPVRPAGISSSNAEKEHARKVANKIARWFRARDIELFGADSGNGYHLLIPTIPYEDVAKASANAHTLLDLLNKEFSTTTATVDTTIYNPSRILKLYGTKAVKGSNLLERPHRFATVKLGDIPGDVDLFGKLEHEITAFREASEAKPKTSLATGKTSGKSTAKKVVAKGGGWDAETSCAVLESLLELSELPYREKTKGNDHLYEFEQCPYHDDPDGHTYECCLIVRSDGSFAAKCQHDADAGWQDFKSCLDWDENIGSVMRSLGLNFGDGSANYQQTDNGLVWNKPTRHGVVPVPLTNFTAKIVSDIAEDDGAEIRHTFEIEASLNDRTYRFTVPAQQFASMTWPTEHLGAQAVVYAGQGIKDHARAAIQVLSEDVATQTVFTHLGWRKHGEEFVYLHAGGAIGEKGNVGDVRVNLSEKLGRFVLPQVWEREAMEKALRASLKFLDVVPDRITMPLFASIWRSVVVGTDFSLHLVGSTGTGKSALAALIQQFWGAELDARNLPANWSSTANANEALAFLAKDALLVVDDFAPTGSQYDVQRAHREADRLIRGQGNGAGRNRMRADATLRPAKPPRGLILSTGEDVPRGQSLRARMLVLEVSDVVNWKRLTYRQRDAAQGLYATALSGFIRWLAHRYKWVRNELMPELLPQFRELANSSDQHKRTPNLVADLYMGLDLFTRFANKFGALSDDESFELLQRGWLALGEAAAAQTIIQGDSDPVGRFVDLLTAALASGKAHVASAEGKRPITPGAWGWQKRGEFWEPRGDRIGWVDGNDLFLEPEAAFVVAQRMALDGGEPLPINSKTLHKRLHEQELLVSTDTKRKRLVIRRKLAGSQRSVLHLRKKTLGST